MAAAEVVIVPPLNAAVTVYLIDKTITIRMAMLQEMPLLIPKIKCTQQPQAAGHGMPCAADTEANDYTLQLDLTMEEFMGVISSVVGKFDPRYYNLVKKYATVTVAMQTEYNKALRLPLPELPSAKKNKYCLLRTYMYENAVDCAMQRSEHTGYKLEKEVLGPKHPRATCRYATNTISIGSSNCAFVFDSEMNYMDLIHTLVLKARLPQLPENYAWKRDVREHLFGSFELHVGGKYRQSMTMQANKCLALANDMWPHSTLVHNVLPILCVPLMFPCTVDFEGSPIYKILDPDSPLMVVINDLRNTEKLVTYTGPAAVEPAGVVLPVNSPHWYYLEADVVSIEETHRNLYDPYVHHEPKKDKEPVTEHDKHCESCDHFKREKEQKAVSRMEEMKIVQQCREQVSAAPLTMFNVGKIVTAESAEYDYSCFTQNTISINLKEFIKLPCAGLFLYASCSIPESMMAYPYPFLSAEVMIGEYLYVHADICDLYEWNYIKTGINRDASRSYGLIPFSRKMARKDNGYLSGTINISETPNCDLLLTFNKNVAFAGWKFRVVALCNDVEVHTK